MADHPSHASHVQLPLLIQGGERAFTTASHLARFAQCPQSYRLHYVEQQPPELRPAQQLGAVLHRALEETVRAHVEAGRQGELDAGAAAEAYRRAWTESGPGEHALFADGLELVQRWIAREGAVDARRVLGVGVEFTVHMDGIALRGAMDRVDRLGDDAIRVRDYSSTRLPPRREDAEESLPLAIADLAARQLWPWARRIEVGVDLLRHDVVLGVERSDAQREATRQYIRATVAQIAAGAWPARPSMACGHCDHRSQCPAWAEACAGERVHAGADAQDLPAVAREREELATVLKALGERKDRLDDVLRAELEHQPLLVLEGRKYALNIAMRRDYPLEATLATLAEAGVPREEAMARLAAVDGGALKELLAAMRARVGRAEAATLQERLDAQARCTPVTRLTVREVRS